MIESGIRPCRHHRGEPEHNCGPCRSERIADPAAEPERTPGRWPSGADLADVIPFRARKEAT